MTDTKEQVEQGKHGPISVAKDTFVALKPDYLKIGRVIGVSVDGLTFTYMPDGKRPGQSSSLDIFSVDRSFYLRDVPFRIMSDVESDRIPFSSIKMRKCTVQFEDLTLHQQDELEYFIDNHTKLGVI